ncbi:hypothetical protein D3C87_2040940 [compost metagenome]
MGLSTRNDPGAFAHSVINVLFDLRDGLGINQRADAYAFVQTVADPQFRDGSP